MERMGKMERMASRGAINAPRLQGRGSGHRVWVKYRARHRRVHRPVLTSVVAAVACASLFALTSAPAQAFDQHAYLSQVTEVPAKGPHGESVPLPGPVTTLQSMTVDQGHLWIAESISGTSNHRVDEFNAETGAFMAQIFGGATNLRYGIAVGHYTGEGEVYAATQTSVVVFSEAGTQQATWTGTPGAGFSHVEDIAVDNSSSLADSAAGDVYVLDGEAVDVFKPETNGKETYVTQITGTPGKPFQSHATSGEGITRVAVDQSSGELIVSNNTWIDLFKPTESMPGQYEFVRQITGPPTSASSDSFGPYGISGIAYDSNGEIYAAERDSDSGFVNEFSSSGAYLGRTGGEGTPEGTFGIPGIDQGLAVDPATHHLFVGVYHENGEPDAVDVFGPDIVVPDVATTPATGVQAAGEGTVAATLNGTVNPDGAGPATCDFIWGTSEAALEHEAKCESTVPDGTSPLPVQASLSGLEPDVTYYFRLTATNANGANPGEAWQDERFTTPGPGVYGESLSDVSAEVATLEASIDPHGTPTTYYFQYGPTSAYGSEIPSAPGPSIGAGEGDVSVSQHVTGLSAHTVYYYRVVALSEVEAGKPKPFYGPNQTFVTQRAGEPLQLPDGRQWELVSPANMHGATMQPIFEQGIIQASASGDAFIDHSFERSPESEPAGEANHEFILSGRGADGWSSRDLSTPHEEAVGLSIGEGWEYRFFSEDLSHAIVQPFGGFTPLSSQATEQTAYLRTDFQAGDPTSICGGESCYSPLVSAANVPSGTHFGEIEEGECKHFVCGPLFLGASPDAQHVVLESPAQLTKTPNEGHRPLYEWNGGALQMVSLLPAGETNEAGGSVAFDAALGWKNRDARHAISANGSRIVFQGRTTESGKPGVDHLYLRDTANGETARLDLPEGGTATGSSEPQFTTASADGSHIFFIDEDGLTAESSPSGKDLYEYDAQAPSGSRLRDLSVDANAKQAADVTNVIGASEDGTYIYFVATGSLTAAKNARGEAAVPGEENLYMRHYDSAGASWEAPVFIATLAQTDSFDWSPYLNNMTSRVSPNGHWLAFMSRQSLTGYDNTDASESTGQHADEEVYLYNAPASSGEEGKLVCGSCNPTGARPVGQEYSSAMELVGADRVFEGWIAALVPPWTPYSLGQALYQSRYLSNSGRLFFDSRDPLVPQDVGGSWGVYEYEPPGLGSCTTASSTYSERDGGCVSLISSPTSGGESAFLDASESGNDVFFLTSSQLVGQDENKGPHVYDAHACTSEAPCFPTPAETPPPCTTTDSCREAPQQQPSVFGEPSSATFSGAGNIAPPTPGVTTPKKVTAKTVKCKKGFVKKKDKCVKQKRKKQKRKSKKAKKSTSRKGSK